MIKDTAGLLLAPALVFGTMITGPAVATASEDRTPRPVERVSATVTEKTEPEPVIASAKAKVNIPRAKITSSPAPPPPPPEPVPVPEAVPTAPTVQVVATQVAPLASVTPQQTQTTAPAVAEVAPVEAQMRTNAPRHRAVQPQATAVKKTEPAPEVAPQASSLSGIAGTALAYKGSPYVWGGESPSGWDCSGFVKFVYAQHGISIPRGTSALLGSGRFVPTSTPKLGDLVFQNGGGHVGIYIGNGQIIGAQNPSVGTVIRPANSPYGPLLGYYTLAG